MQQTDFVRAMDLALDCAREAMRDSGDVPVGAVILDPQGNVVATGQNERELTGDPTAHAEIVAIRQARIGSNDWRLEGHTLVVTLEPCAMCAGAIVAARIERVVFGAWDPKAGAAGSMWDLLRDRRLNHRPEVVAGIRESESSQLLTDFFASHRD